MSVSQSWPSSCISLHINEALFLLSSTPPFFIPFSRPSSISLSLSVPALQKCYMFVSACGLVNTRILMFAILTSAFVIQLRMYLLPQVIELCVQLSTHSRRRPSPLHKHTHTRSSVFPFFFSIVRRPISMAAQTNVYSTLRIINNENNNNLIKSVYTYSHTHDVHACTYYLLLLRQ